MNWKIILQLSLFGLIMAIGTISLIPMSIEPFFWLIIFALSAFIIAKTCSGSYFLNGFVLCLVNCFWITGIHLVYHDDYLFNHPEMKSMQDLLPAHHRIALAISGVLIGVVSGLVLGSFSLIASKLIRRTRAVA